MFCRYDCFWTLKNTFTRTLFSSLDFAPIDRKFSPIRCHKMSPAGSVCRILKFLFQRGTKIGIFQHDIYLIKRIVNQNFTKGAPWRYPALTSGWWKFQINGCKSEWKKNSCKRIFYKKKKKFWILLIFVLISGVTVRRWYC